MPRPLRPQIPGASHHVTARGVESCAIHRDVRDRIAFLERLEDVVTRFGWRLLAYCLMTNHYHLVVADALARRPTAERHARAAVQHASPSNGTPLRRPLRLAAPRDGRARPARLPLRRPQPVRAGLCAAPNGWRWSSFFATAGQAPAPTPTLLATADLLPHFGPTEEAARAAYRTFVEEPPGAERIAA